MALKIRTDLRSEWDSGKARQLLRGIVTEGTEEIRWRYLSSLVRADCVPRSSARTAGEQTNLFKRPFSMNSKGPLPTYLSDRIILYTNDRHRYHTAS